ncbi:MAG: TRAP transporter large permease [Spirochaetales bacterium]|jgi:C4-dicarboxylate transporter DctM subunit|nr:TRAP transporter large permease [Spirochaetales bacterium]
MIALLFISFFVLMFLNIPIAVCLGTAAIITIIFGINVPLVITAQTMFNGINSFPLMAIPFFILAGNLMGEGGISRQLVKFINLFFARIRGGLAMVAIGASMFFAAISGSCPATTAAIGAVMVPEMEKNGYDRLFTAATVASAGTLGQIIPPSIPMVTYCVLSGTSVSKLFLTGVGPGILMGLFMMGVAYYYAVKHRIARVAAKITFTTVLKTLSTSIWALIMPLIILGGIYSGIFTPTEAGAVAAVYGFFVGVFVYRDLKVRDIPRVICNSAVGAAVIMLIMAVVSTFGFVLTREHIPQSIAESLLAVTRNKYVLVFLFNIIVLIAGCFLQSSAAIALLTPILLPVLTSVGINPYMMGIIFIVNMGIGMITPPVGSCLYVACNIAGVKFEALVKACVPYLIVLGIALLMISYIEPIAMTLANLVGG